VCSGDNEHGRESDTGERQRDREIPAASLSCAELGWRSWSACRQSGMMSSTRRGGRATESLDPALEQPCR
jgi:hypothetical protein